MLKKFSYFLVLFSCLSFSQTITVDDTSYTDVDLANLLLNGSCIDPTNVSYSSGQAVAQFDGNGSTFPLSEGIIIRTGIAKNTEGIYTDTNLSDQLNTNSDPDLQAISNNTGQTDPITDTAFLQFDFVPISSDFSFNFVFASNEYGQWQCGFSDVFAFLLTDITAATTTNLAIIPGTTDPVTITTIRDNAYNGGCTSENANLFDTYNVTNPASSTLNMRGHTTVLNASSTLVPGNSYRIRLVIGDYKNQNFDSAVFIDTGSFTTEIDLGEDTTMCAGNTIDLTTGLDITDYNHSWTLNGNPIVGATDNTLTVTQAGTYGVIAIKNGTACQIPGTITITDLQIASPNDLTICDDGSATYNYDLSSNNEALLGLDPAVYDVIYFATPADIINDTPITGNDITSYTSAGNETIYIKILNIATGVYCTAELTFLLTVSATANATQPNDISVCESTTTTTVDLTTQNSDILNGLNPADFIITYYASQADLNNQIPIAGSSIDIPSGATTQEIWAQMTSSTNANCFDTTSFNITVNPLPVVATLDNVLECTEYTLPPIPDVDGDGIPDGVYYDATDGPNGAGNQLNVGDLIEVGSVIYIHVGPDANGCYNESSFILTFIDEYTVNLYHCGEFSVPVLPPGDFYTETDGLNGAGTVIAPTTIFTSADLPLTVHYYAETTDPVTNTTTVCRNEAFDITIYDLPPVDTLSDVVTCVSYTLEPLTNGIYYNSPNGVDPITNLTLTTSQTVHIFNTEVHNFGTAEEITCSSPNSSFEVTIITVQQDVTRCANDRYELPPLSSGNYYLQPGGIGITLPEEDEIYINEDGDLTFLNNDTIVLPNPVEIFVFANDTENIPNCTNNLSFNLQINPNPIVDELDDLELCINTPYIIGETDVLTNPGAFYVDDQLVEFPISNTTYTTGHVITTDSTIYIYYQDPITGCETQSSFEVDIRELPPLANPGDEYICETPYELTPLTDGGYFNSPGGENDPTLTYPGGNTIEYDIPAGTVANETIQVYLYNEWDDLAECAIERIITVYVLGINLGEFEDKNECDTYTLPPLTIGKYYRQPNGVDEILPADYTFSYTNDPTTYTTDNPTTNTHTFYVYETNGIPERDPELCNAEESFTITISETPILPSFTNEVVCGEYLLPATSTISTTYDVNYYTAAGGNTADLINPSTPLTIPEGESSPYTTTIHVYATATGNTDCSDFDSFTVTIYERPNFTVNDTIICVDPDTGVVAPENYVLLESGIDPAQFTVNWYLNGNLVHTGADYYAEQPGVYTVETVMIATEIPPDCNYNPTTVTVLESSTATATYSVTEDFEDTATVTVAITNGSGTYQYQLDDGPFQDSNVFHDVVSGDHIITILDIYGNCGEYELPIVVLKYPKFFTPNGDGINDTWNIVNLTNQPDSKINIFDRFGKFIVQIAPSGNGWDGSYNNSQLPSSDYWFSVSYKGRNGEDKEFKAHFSLKR